MMMVKSVVAFGAMPATRLLKISHCLSAMKAVKSVKVNVKE